jgi:hypothetical protein
LAFFFFAFEVQFANPGQKKKKKFHDDDPTHKKIEGSSSHQLAGECLENKESLQHIKNISLIFSPISFLIFLLDFLNLFHFNIF